MTEKSRSLKEIYCANINVNVRNTLLFFSLIGAIGISAVLTSNKKLDQPLAEAHEEAGIEVPGRAVNYIEENYSRCETYCINEFYAIEKYKKDTGLKLVYTSEEIDSFLELANEQDESPSKSRSKEIANYFGFAEFNLYNKKLNNKPKQQAEIFNKHTGPMFAHLLNLLANNKDPKAQIAILKSFRANGAHVGEDDYSTAQSYVQMTDMLDRILKQIPKNSITTLRPFESHREIDPDSIDSFKDSKDIYTHLEELQINLIKISDKGDVAYRDTITLEGVILRNVKSEKGDGRVYTIIH
jgi:hypothetical protein